MDDLHRKKLKMTQMRVIHGRLYKLQRVQMRRREIFDESRANAQDSISSA